MWMQQSREQISDLRFSSSACTREAALDKTSNGVSIPLGILENSETKFQRVNSQAPHHHILSGILLVHAPASAEGSSHEQQERDSRKNQPPGFCCSLSPCSTSTGLVTTRSVLKTRKHWNQLSHQTLIQNKREDQIPKHLAEADECSSCMLQQGHLL